MSGWAARKKRHEEMLRGYGKHEALLLECKLREYRNPFRDSRQIKSMDREKKKIENELIKIRHTIHHERRNPRALTLSTRSLTIDAIAPSRRHSFSAQNTEGAAINSVSPTRVTNTRLSLDPSLLVNTDRLKPGKRSVYSNSLDDLTREDESGVSQLKGIHEEMAEMPTIEVKLPSEGDTVDNKAAVNQNPGLSKTGALEEVTTATTTTELQTDTADVITEEPLMNHLKVPTVATSSSVPVTSNLPGLDIGQTHGSLFSVPGQRLCRRQPTFLQGRQPTFTNRSNTYIKKRRELNNNLDALSCANYNEMRQGIANETLKKLGLL